MTDDLLQMLKAFYPAWRRGGQPPLRSKRIPRRRQSAFARRSAVANRDQADPAGLVAQMRAAGATFYLRTDAERRNFKFAFRLRDDADVERFKSLLVKAKSDPQLLALVRVEVFVAIMRETRNLPARSA